MVNKSLIIIVFLLFSLLGSLFLVFRTTIFIGKATSSNSSAIALENSYLFASPLQAKADGKEKIRVTIFLLDGRGLGVSNKLVVLETPVTIDSASVQATTDDSGKAVFDLSSNQITTTEISATVDSQKIPQKIKVNFN